MTRKVREQRRKPSRVSADPNKPDIYICDGNLHEKAVYERLQARWPTLKRYGFTWWVLNLCEKVIRERGFDECESEEEFEIAVAEELKEISEHLSFRPDGFVVDLEKSEVLMFEIEGFNPVSLEKAKMMGIAYDLIMDLGIELKLFVVPDDGNIERLADLGAAHALCFVKRPPGKNWRNILFGGWGEDGDSPTA